MYVAGASQSTSLMVRVLPTLGAVVALGAGALIWTLSQGAQKLNSMTEYDAQTGSSGSAAPPRKDAVLVFGSTGKLGRQIVLQVGSVPPHSLCASMPMMPSWICSIVGSLSLLPGYAQELQTPLDMPGRLSMCEEGSAH